MLQEIIGNQVLYDRQSDIRRKAYSLGPFDLVCRTVKENSFLLFSKTANLYHYVCGVPFNAMSAAGYLANYKARLRDCGVTQMSIYSYDSFDDLDVVVSANFPGRCECHAINSKGECVELSNKIWKNVYISDALRYYRGTSSLLSSLFSVYYVQTPKMNVMKHGVILNLDDFVYVMRKHEITDELLHAISSSLVICLSFKEIKAFLNVFAKNYPKLLSFICNVIPFKSQFGIKLYPFIHKLFRYSYDEVEIAIPLVYFYIEINQINKCDEFLYLLNNAVKYTPMAAITLARICCAKNDYEKALFYLNLAGNSDHWPKTKIKKFDKYIYTDIKTKTNKYDKEILNYELSGPYFEYNKVLTKIIKNFTFFKNAHAKLKKSLSSRIFKLKKDVLIENKKTIYNDNNLMYLYDPGIELKDKNLIPFDNDTYNMYMNLAIEEIENTLHYKKKIIEVDSCHLDLTKALLIGYKLKDKELMNIISQELKIRNEISAIDKILLIKCILSGIGNFNICDVLNLKLNSKHESLYHMIDLVNSINRLNNESENNIKTENKVN